MAEICKPPHESSPLSPRPQMRRSGLLFHFTRADLLTPLAGLGDGSEVTVMLSPAALLSEDY